MNKHLKIAFMVVPILAIIGFGAADYYEEHEAAQSKMHVQLTAK